MRCLLRWPRARALRQCDLCCIIFQGRVRPKPATLNPKTLLDITVCLSDCNLCYSMCADRFRCASFPAELVALEREVGGLMAQQAAAEARKAVLDMQVGSQTGESLIGGLG